MVPSPGEKARPPPRKRSWYRSKQFKSGVAVALGFAASMYAPYVESEKGRDFLKLLGVCLVLGGGRGLATAAKHGAVQNYLD